MKTLFVIFTLIGSACAQLWSGYIDPSRATPNWATAGYINTATGAKADPPSRTDCATQPTLTSSASDLLADDPGNAVRKTNTDNMNAAIAVCSGFAVRVPAGYYWFGYDTAGALPYYSIRSQVNSVTIKGAGPDQTMLVFSHPNTTLVQGDITIATTSATYAGDAKYLPGGAQAADWTAGYTAGTTVVTLSSVTGIVPGDMLILDQPNGQVGISSCSQVGTIATCTTRTAHGFSPGDSVGVGNVNNVRTETGYNKRRVTVTATPSATEFSYDLAPISGLATLSGGGAAKDNGEYWVCNVVGACNQYGNVQTTGRVIDGIDHNQQQIARVVSVDGVAKQVTITPGLTASNWTGTPTPGAWWIHSFVTENGVEDLALNHTNSVYSSAPFGGIVFNGCYNCWVRNVRSLNGPRNHVWESTSARIEVRDSYFYGTRNAATQSYGVEYYRSSDSLTINNIFQHLTSPIATSPSTDVVNAYNYLVDMHYLNPPNAMMGGVFVGHEPGAQYSLTEGNKANQVERDVYWGSSGGMTIFRNYFTGTEFATPISTLTEVGTTVTVTCTSNHGYSVGQNVRIIGTSDSNYNRTFNVTGVISPTVFTFTAYASGRPPASGGFTSRKTQYTYPVTFQSLGRYMNVIGNVLGTAGWHDNYEDSAYGVSGAGWDVRSIYVLGYAGVSEVNSCCAYDNLVMDTLMRWCNYDTATSTVRSLAAEVPSTLPKYANAVPADCNFPASFFLSSKPAFFGTGVTWPPIDVNSAACTGPGNHICKIPSELAYEAMGGLTDGSSGILTFTGRYYALNITQSATTHSFGNQTTGTSSAAFSVTVTNDSVVSAMPVVMAFATGTQFSQTNNCGVSLAPQASCTVNITFSPTTDGLKPDTLTIATSVTVAVDGTGTSSGPASPTCALSCSPLVGKLDFSSTCTLTLTSAPDTCDNGAIDGETPGACSHALVVTPAALGTVTHIGVVRGPNGTSQCTSDVRTDQRSTSQAGVR